MTRFILLLAATVLACGNAQAQDAMIQPHTYTEMGGYMAPSMKFTPIVGTVGTMVGGRGGLLINHRYSMGVAAYSLLQRFGVGLAGPNAVQAPDPSTPLEINIGYGGMDLRFFNDTRDKFHWSADLLVGGGVFTLSYPTGYSVDVEMDDGFVVFEPGLSGGLNITPFLLLNAGFGYRFVGDVKANPWLEAEDLTGWTMTLSLLFGTF